MQPTSHHPLLARSGQRMGPLCRVAWAQGLNGADSRGLGQKHCTLPTTATPSLGFCYRTWLPQEPRAYAQNAHSHLPQPQRDRQDIHSWHTPLPWTCSTVLCWSHITEVMYQCHSHCPLTLTLRSPKTRSPCHFYSRPDCVGSNERKPIGCTHIVPSLCS